MTAPLNPEARAYVQMTDQSDDEPWDDATDFGLSDDVCHCPECQEDA